MNRIFKYFIVVFLTLFLISPAFGFSQHDVVTYYVSSEKITAGWDACNGNNVKYDVYLKRFEWDEIVQKNMNIIETEKELTFPKSGLYIIMVRARSELSTFQIDSLASLNKEELIQKVIEWKLEEDIGDNSILTADQIRNIIIEIGMASEWTVSNSGVNTTVDGEPRGWWVYSYIASPGTIIIGGIDSGPNGP